MSHRWPLIRLSYRYMPRGLGSCVYRFELPSILPLSFSLTFDDAPGDHPEAFAELLDILAHFQARSTFFCMADKITPQMAPLLARAVKEGHQLGNHMSEDRSYYQWDKDCFERELDYTEAVLAEFEPGVFANDHLYSPGNNQDTVTTYPRFFRPPKGRQSATMTSVLEEHRYFPSIMGDIFSNDPFVGSSLVPTSQYAVDYHVEYVLKRLRPGSIVIFHCPRANGHRVQVLDCAIRILHEAVAVRGWTAATIGAMAAASNTASRV